MFPSLKKRFWKDVSVAARGEGYEVFLDTSALRTPSKTALVLPTRELADAIAAEWDAQDRIVDPTTMPMTRRANTAIDKVTKQQAEVAHMLAEYGGSDLCCYRAEFPVELAKRQAAAWDPVLQWAEAKFAAPLKVTTGIIHVGQDQQSLMNYSKPVQALGPFQLTGFHDLVTHSGSLLIALATIFEFADPSDLWDRSQVDEIWQTEQWGADDEATITAAQKSQEYQDAFRFINLVGMKVYS
jgi:chaperone required for assembly of F1-ATPase